MNKLHNVERDDFEGPMMVLSVDGQIYRLEVARISRRLAGAIESGRRFYRVSPSGFGIHWPEVDEDLTVDGLIQASQEASANPTDSSTPQSSPALILNDKRSP